MRIEGIHTQVLIASELPKGIVLMPEQRMLAALLERAYLDYFIYPRAIEENNLKRQKFNTIEDPINPRIEFIKLKAWFRSNAKHPFSFLWICEHFAPTWDSLPEQIRKAIAQPKLDGSIINKLNGLKSR